MKNSLVTGHEKYIRNAKKLNTILGYVAVQYDGTNIMELHDFVSIYLPPPIRGNWRLRSKDNMKWVSVYQEHSRDSSTYLKPLHPGDYLVCLGLAGLSVIKGKGGGRKK